MVVTARSPLVVTAVEPLPSLVVDVVVGACSVLVLVVVPLPLPGIVDGARVVAVLVGYQLLLP